MSRLISKLITSLPILLKAPFFNCLFLEIHIINGEQEFQVREEKEKVSADKFSGFSKNLYPQTIAQSTSSFLL